MITSAQNFGFFIFYMYSKCAAQLMLDFVTASLFGKNARKIQCHKIS